MKFKFAITSLFFLSNCAKYESPIFYFHNVSNRPLKEINCKYNGNKFGFDGLWLMGSIKDLTANGSSIKNPSFSAIKLFSYEISNNEEFFGKMVCNLKNFKGETKNFQFEVGKNDIDFLERKHFIIKPWLMPVYFVAGVILPFGIGKNRKVDFFIPHVNIYLSQDNYEIVFSNDKNYFDKDNFYIEIMQKNELNYIKEKTLNKNLNY
jgi:hypothetical protein